MFSIKNIILHELQKNEDGELSLHLSKSKARPDVNVEYLVQQMHRVFTAKAGKGFGFFSDEAYKSDIATYGLDHYLKGEVSFHALTVKLAEKLHQQLVCYPFADSGVLVFAEYESLANDCLLIGIIPKAHSLIATEGLAVDGVDYLDINNMTIAARIDMAELTVTAIGEEARYVSFMRSGNKRRMNDFFIDFLGIEVATESKAHSQTLLQAIEDFLSDSNVGDESRSMLERASHAYCDGQIKLKEDISIKELSDTISADFDQSFADYIKEQGYELDDEFEGDRASLRRLVKISGTGGGLSVSFDARLLNERVFYDIETDFLTIKGTPPALRDVISRKAKATQGAKDE